MPRAEKPTPSPKPVQRKVARMTAREAHESAKKAQALIRLGLYSPRRKISARTKFTPRQEKYIAEKFRRLQSHGRFIQGKGTVRPMKRTQRGYVLTPYFRKDKRKLIDKGAGIIATRKGAIVPRSLGSVRKMKDGSIITTQWVLGKERKVRSATLSPRQSIKFVYDILDGEFEMPSDTFIRMHIFGQQIPDEAFSIADLKKWAAKYGKTISNFADKNLRSLTIDYISLDKTTK